MAALTAIALTIFIVEAQIPALAPIPGIKLGLANIVTVYAMFAMGPRSTLMILLARIILGSLFTGGITILYSLAGGMLGYLVMLILHRIVTMKQMWVCSVISGMAHNIGQITVAILITSTVGLVIYLPVLLVSGILTGLFTGLCAQFLVNRLNKLNIIKLT